MLRIDEDVGKAACFFFGTVEAEEACCDDAGFAVTARDGVGQPARRAFIARAAVGRIAELHAFVTAQLSIRAAPLVDVGRVDDQRATQRAQQSGSDQRANEHQN
jgi:hypothetical protein